MRVPGGRYGLVMVFLLVCVFFSISGDAPAQQKDTLRTRDWQERLERLRAVPYVGLTEEVVDERDTSVTYYREDKSYYGYNLYCTQSSSRAVLMDMNGHVVHRWCLGFDEGKCHCDLALLLGDGGLLGVENIKRVFLLGWDSELIWERKLRVHHDMAQASDGSFFVLTQDRRKYCGLKVIFDEIVHLSPDGEIVDRWSSYDRLEELREVLDTRSFLDVIMDSLKAGQSQAGGDTNSVRKEMMFVRIDNRLRDLDYFHTNAVNVLPATELGERDGRFGAGNLLVCFRNVNQIAILERDTYRVLWAWGEGELEWPHDPTMLDDGHILIFDNGTRHPYSRIVELDPSTESIVWEYTEVVPEDFCSPKMGSVQRLPNGNTLICASGDGRVFEVTPKGRKVWAWSNPDVHGKRREVIARMRRLSPVFVEKLLNRPEGLR
jgi:hypothetical protein